MKYILIGYDTSSKGYRLYNPTNKKVFSSRDVAFDEEDQWTWTTGKEGEEKSNHSLQGVSWGRTAIVEDDITVQMPLPIDQHNKQEDYITQQEPSTENSSANNQLSQTITLTGGEHSPETPQWMRSLQEIYEVYGDSHRATHESRKTNTRILEWYIEHKSMVLQIE